MVLLFMLHAITLYYFVSRGFESDLLWLLLGGKHEQDKAELNNKCWRWNTPC